jgi:hypothetical protein
VINLTLREDVCERVRTLSDDGVARVVDFLACLEDEDDEPLSEDALARIERSMDDIAHGRVYTLEEAERRLAALA